MSTNNVTTVVNNVNIDLNSINIVEALFGGYHIKGNKPEHEVNLDALKVIEARLRASVRARSARDGIPVLFRDNPRTFPDYFQNIATFCSFVQLFYKKDEDFCMDAQAYLFVANYIVGARYSTAQVDLMFSKSEPIAKKLAAHTLALVDLLKSGKGGYHPVDITHSSAAPLIVDFKSFLGKYSGETDIAKVNSYMGLMDNN